MSKTISKSQLFNLLSGIVIIVFLMYNIATGANWVAGVASIVLFGVSYILERSKVTFFACLPITLVALIWAISPFIGTLVFAP